MKDIYELLNDIEFDEHEFEEMEVDEIEKAKYKRNLRKSITNKRSGSVWKKSAAVVAVIGLSLVSLGLTFPAYALNIPIVRDIFRFLDGEKTGLYDQYKENSTEINQSKESNGITVTLSDAIFDGKTVSVAYTIESEHDLGEVEHLQKPPFVQPFIIIEGESGWTGNSRLSKVGENQYVGITTASNHRFEEKDAVTVQLVMPGFMTKHDEEIQGDWKFELDLQATEHNVQVINQSAQQKGIQVEVGKMTVTPMSFIIYYNNAVPIELEKEWPGIEVDLQVKDDLGHSYDGEVNGGWSDQENGITLGYNKTFEKLDEEATKLIITPHMKLYKDIEQDGTYIGKETFVLEDIIVELKK